MFQAGIDIAKKKLPCWRSMQKDEGGSGLVSKAQVRNDSTFLFEDPKNR